MRMKHLVLTGVVVALVCWASSNGAEAATIEYHYESWTVGGHTTSGVLDYIEFYECPNGAPPGGMTWLDPYPPQLLTIADATATTANGKIDTFYEALTDEFKPAAGWTFGAAKQNLSGVFDVHTYDAVGTTSAVGADFHVEYRPAADLGPGANLHWIQVISTNHPLRGAGAGHGTPATYVDIFAGQTNPFYDFMGATGFDGQGDFHFYDAPRRPDVCRDHYWYADLYLVTGPAFTANPRAVAPGAVTVLGGIRWGWQNEADCVVPEPATMALLGVGLLCLAVRGRAVQRSR